jgi:RNA polymerase-binding transcription factor DksA
MATKKAAPKKAVKSAKPAKKAPAKKPAASKKVAKPVAKKAVKKAAPKKAVKKPAPAPKKAAKPAPKPVKKSAHPVAKKPAAPAKKAVNGTKHVAAKHAEPVKKPAVAAPTHHEVKPAIKPLAQPVVKKEPPKPTKVVIPKTSTNKSVKYDPDFTRSVLDSPNNENTGPTMRYSDVELIEFRELIQKKLDTAKKELAYLQGLITRKDEGDMEDGRYMTMEDGSMSMEREQLSQMASRQIQFIDHLEKALMRIENKTYGICRVTGKLIDKARLRAVPHATLSIEAKQMMNK